LTSLQPIKILDSQAILELDLDGVKLIEASAGTGKTHTIADLYLRHILAGRLTSQILIVTYTNAATEELRGRIRKRLYQAVALLNAGDCAEDGLLPLWWEQWQNLDAPTQALQLGRLQLALRSLDEAAISTIHSFCQRSLQEHALAGNQLFDSDMLSDDSALWEAALKDWWRALSYDLDNDVWQLVRDSLGGVDNLVRRLLVLRNKPSAELLPPVAGSLPDLLEQPRQIAANLHRLTPLWTRHKAEIVEIITTSKALSRTRKLPYHADNLDAWIDAADYFFNSPAAGDLFENFQYLAAEWLDSNSKPSQRGNDPRLAHEFFQAIDPIANGWYEFSRNLGPRLLVDALQQSSRRVLEDKRKQAVLAFQDQLNLLLEALQAEQGSELAQSLRQQYPVAMIDEFQDTDNIQYRIFGHIYHTAADASLTLIGDPKQAIYSFRGGDIFTYMQARRLPAWCVPSIRCFAVDLTLSSIETLSISCRWRRIPTMKFIGSC